MIVRLALIGLAIGILNWSSPSSAQMVCQDRKSVETTLKNNFGEKRTAFGITNNGSLLVLYVSKDGKTWTIVRILPGGVACLMGAGTDWHWLPRGTRIRLMR